MTKSNKQAFTLIELLVVVLIIGILAAVAVPQYQKAVFKAHMTEAMTNLKTLANAVKVCELAHNGKVSRSDGNPCVEPENLDIELGQTLEKNHFETDDFIYQVDRDNFSSLDTISTAMGLKYNVCLCLHDDGSMAVSQGNCIDGINPPFNVNNVLGIEDDECSCC
ncbi:MAG: pilin [Elusimicrobiaceae bacterium]|nr:pilin [Elusimicrobiaceae bacterium]